MNFEKTQLLTQELKQKIRNADRRTILIAAGSFAILFLFLVTWHLTFGAPQLRETASTFVVPQNDGGGQIAQTLEEQHFVRHAWAFEALMVLRGIRGAITPGSYALSKSLNAWQIASILGKPPSAVWVVIPEGLRKEEIADILTNKLGWTAAQKQEWLTQDTNTNWNTMPPTIDPDYSEGVYFPDTYLIPMSDTPAQVAKRLQDEFNTQFAPLASEALRQDIKWTTVIKIASILQREAGGKDDMPIIAGIIWNRLEDSMPLDIDATLQYSRGNAGSGYWAPITPAFKKIDSPYNTYKHAGLPPTPISNPGLDALKAVLYPAKTNCIYYLHDSDGNIHCSPTYDGQLKNIDKYY